MRKGQIRMALTGALLERLLELPDHVSVVEVSSVREDGITTLELTLESFEFPEVSDLVCDPEIHSVNWDFRINENLAKKYNLSEEQVEFVLSKQRIAKLVGEDCTFDEMLRHLLVTDQIYDV